MPPDRRKERRPGRSPLKNIAAGICDEPQDNILDLVGQGRFDGQLALVREHWHSCRHLWLATPEPLKVARLGPDLPSDFSWSAGLPGLANIQPIGDGRFAFAEAGQPALIVPTYDCIPGILDANAERHVDHLVDLVAVDFDQPDRLWRRRGEALVLGLAYLEVAAREGEPVPVFKNPMSWLRSGGAGICILDWTWVRDLLLDLDLVAEDLDVGERLEDALRPNLWIRGAA